MRKFLATTSNILLILILANSLSCTKTSDSQQSGPTPGTAAPTVNGSNGSMPAAETLDTQALDRRIRETVLITLDPYCDNDLKKVADEKSADLKFKATINCKNEPPYGRTKDVPRISIAEFFAIIDLIQADLASLKTRTDATDDQRQMVEAFEQAFKEDEGKVLLETKGHYEKNFRARTAMLATLNMKITRHPYANGRQAHDTVEWIDGASREVSLAAGVRQICTIHKEKPSWYGGALWMTNENRYTSAHDTARMVSELVFASVGAETSFTPPGIETNWVMTGVKEFLQAYYGYWGGIDICYQDAGIEELDKIVTMIKSGEWAQKWAALPKVSKTSAIYLHDSISSPNEEGVLFTSKLSVEFTQQPNEGHKFKAGFAIKIPRDIPSHALDLAASSANQGIKALDEVVALTQEFTQAIREAAPTRKAYPEWVAISFASLSATPGVYVRDLIQDTRNARGAINTKDKWLPEFVKYDTTEKANDYEFSSCRRTNVLPRLVYNSKQDFSTIKCKGGELIWYVRE